MVPGIERTEVDGVPALWSNIPGPLTAALTFRVGVADEQALVAGITHLVEHLAVPRDDPPGADVNADTGVLTTTFFARGARLDVCRFLAQVCTALVDLPTAGIDEEVGVVRAELASNDTDVTTALLGLRFGARAHGLMGFEPLGYRRRSGIGSIATSWSQQYFTRSNARLCLSGPPPAELALPLAAGAPRRPDRIAPMPVDLPAWAAVPSSALSIGMLSSWRPGLGVALAIAARRLRRSLRDAGATYDVGALAMPLDAENVHHSLSADCTAESAPRVRDALLVTLRDLGAAGPTEEELDDDRARFARQAEEPDAQFGWLVNSAEGELIGGWTPGPDEYVRTLQSLTPDSVRDALRAAMDTAILLLPEGTDGPRRWHPIPMGSAVPAPGREYRPSGLGWLTSPERLVVGPEAISYRGRDRIWMTIRWADLVFFGHEGSDGVLIADRHGQSVELPMGLWANSHDLYQAIVRQVPRDLRVSIDLD